MNRLSACRLLGHGLWVTAVLGLAIIAGIAIGETSISLPVIGQVLANKLWAAGYPVDLIDEGIVWNYRLTRAIVAAASGAGLAISGVVLQSLLRNPLADPYLLGISAGASTGAVLVAIIGVGAGAISCLPVLSPVQWPPLHWWPCLPAPRAARRRRVRSFWRALPAHNCSTPSPPS